MRLPAGTRLDVVMSKWGDRPHWEFEATYLGADQHGDWAGLPPGTHFARPGLELTSSNTQLVLVPPDAWWVAAFHGADGPPRRGWPELDGASVEVYVDMATPAAFDGTTVRCVDLDLDVLRGLTGVVHVDDEDEFEEHRVEYGYPADVVAAARSACDDVRRMALDRSGPFDGLAPGVWFDRLGSL